MELTSAKEIQLSNFEVYKILKESQPAGGQTKRTDPLATIRYETLEYLKRTPCVNQTEENIRTFLNAIKGYGLKKDQIIALLNHQPKNEVEISYLIEDDRFTDDTLLELVKCVTDCLPPHQDKS